MPTFKSVFGNGGNIAGFEWDWQCEDCGKQLDFLLVVESKTSIDWQARCCGTTYIISPFAACYCKEKP